MYVHCTYSTLMIYIYAMLNLVSPEIWNVTQLDFYLLIFLSFSSICSLYISLLLSLFHYATIYILLLYYLTKVRMDLAADNKVLNYPKHTTIILQNVVDNKLNFYGSKNNNE